MVGVFPMHVTLSDGSDGRAVLYYRKGMIFFTAFVSIQGLYPRVPAHHFCVKVGFWFLFPKSKTKSQGTTIPLQPNQNNKFDWKSFLVISD